MFFYLNFYVKVVALDTLFLLTTSKVFILPVINAISFRRMFPTVRCSFGGLNKFIGTQTLFAILLDIIPYDNRRYRYAYHRSSWLVAGKADPTPPHRYFVHQDGPFTVDQLNSSNHLVSFDKVKLTNNELDATGQVI